MEPWQWIVLVLLIGAIGFWFYLRKKQAGPGSNQPPQKGIIR